MIKAAQAKKPVIIWQVVVCKKSWFNKWICDQVVVVFTSFRSLGVLLVVEFESNEFIWIISRVCLCLCLRFVPFSLQISNKMQIPQTHLNYSNRFLLRLLLDLLELVNDQAEKIIQNHISIFILTTNYFGRYDLYYILKIK